MYALLAILALEMPIEESLPPETQIVYRCIGPASELIDESLIEAVAIASCAAAQLLDPLGVYVVVAVEVEIGGNSLRLQ